MNIYIDTISIYHDYPKRSIKLNPNIHWGIKNEQKGNHSVTCHWAHDNNITIRIYDCIFGVARIFITCSIPKVVHNHNYWYIDSSDIPVFISKVESTLQAYILSPQNISILSFQLSRADLFYMHNVPPELKEVYLNAFGKMGNGHYKQFNYINTRYISCKLFCNDKDKDDGKARLSAVVVRIYDKDLEVFNRYYPEAVHEDFIYRQHAEYIPSNYIRLEVSMLRQKLTNRLGVNFATLGDLLLNPTLQAEILDNYFQTLGLYNRVLSAPNFRNEVATIAKTPKTYHNIINTARLKRNDRNPNISPDALRYINDMLSDNGLSIITTSKHDLIPIDQAALLAQNAVFEELPKLSMWDFDEISGIYI